MTPEQAAYNYLVECFKLNDEELALELSSARLDAFCTNVRANVAERLTLPAYWYKETLWPKADTSSPETGAAEAVEAIK